MTSTHNHSGTTLIEVILASSILVSIIALLTTALTGTFQSYGTVQSTSNIDQDGQYIVARLIYASSRNDPSIMSYQSLESEFSATGSVFVATQTAEVMGGEVVLSGTNITGTYTSPVFVLPASKTLRTFTANTYIPASSSLQYRVAIANKVSGSCPSSDASYTYTGPGGSTSAYYTTQSFTIHLGTVATSYTNPGECLKYRIYFNRTSSAIASPQVYDVTTKDI